MMTVILMISIPIRFNYNLLRNLIRMIMCRISIPIRFNYNSNKSGFFTKSVYNFNSNKVQL